MTPASTSRSMRPGRSPQGCDRRQRARPPFRVKTCLRRRCGLPVTAPGRPQQPSGATNIAPRAQCFLEAVAMQGMAAAGELR